MTYLNRLPERQKDLLIQAHDRAANQNRGGVAEMTLQSSDYHVMAELRDNGFIRYTEPTRLLDGDIYTDVTITGQGRRVLDNAGVKA